MFLSVIKLYLRLLSVILFSERKPNCILNFGWSLNRGMDDGEHTHWNDQKMAAARGAQLIGVLFAVFY